MKKTFTTVAIMTIVFFLAIWVIAGCSSSSDNPPPVDDPTASPTYSPTVTPTIEPTIIPTDSPTPEPTMLPTAIPNVKMQKIGIPLNAVWYSQNNYVFAVGNLGIVLFFDGTDWLPMDSDTTAHLQSVWGMTSKDVYAAGTLGTIIRYKGENKWENVLTEGSINFVSVSGYSSNDVFAAGNVYSAETNIYTPTCKKFNGTTWEDIILPTGGGHPLPLGDAVQWANPGDPPNPFKANSLKINSVWSAPFPEEKTKAYLCGKASYVDENGFATHTTSVILVWNGGDYFYICYVPYDNAELNVIWAASGLEGDRYVFAAGTDSKVYYGKNYAWLGAPDSGGLPPGLTFRTIGGPSNSQMYFGANNGKIYKYAFNVDNPGVSVFTEMNSNTTGNVIGISGYRGDSMVGLSTENNSFLTFDGKGPLDWDAYALSLTNDFLYKAWGSAANNVFAVGGDGVIVHFDGDEWTAQNSGIFTNLYGLTGFDANSLVAVGQSGKCVITSDGGTTWNIVATGVAEHLYDVWGTALNNTYAVGDGGRIVKFNGTTWSTVTSPTELNIYSIWGSAENDIYIVGDEGKIFHSNGTTWTQLASPTSDPLFRVWGFAANDIYAAGENGTIIHNDGTGWKKMNDSGTTNQLRGIWGISDVVYAMGWNGTTIVNTTGEWENFPTGVTVVPYYDAWGSSVNNLHFFGGSGVILKYEKK